MLRAENLTWIGDPSQPYDKKYKRWPHWTVWPYKMRFDGKECNTPFIMGIEEHEVYLTEEQVLKEVGKLKISLLQCRILLDTIEKYGAAREQKGRDDVEENMAERDDPLAGL